MTRQATNRQQRIIVVAGEKISTIIKNEANGWECLAAAGCYLANPYALRGLLTGLGGPSAPMQPGRTGENKCNRSIHDEPH